MARTLRTHVFQAWFRLSRPMTLGSRVLARDAHGRFLLVRHGYTPGWHLPGGGVERGETLEEAAVRELAEEGGARAVEPLRLIHVFANFANFPGDHVALFDAPAWEPCPPRGGPEIAERGFFAADALPDGTTRATRARIREAAEGLPPGPNW